MEKVVWKAATIERTWGSQLNPGAMLGLKNVNVNCGCPKTLKNRITMEKMYLLYGIRETDMGMLYLVLVSTYKYKGWLKMDMIERRDTKINRELKKMS